MTSFVTLAIHLFGVASPSKLSQYTRCHDGTSIVRVLRVGMSTQYLPH